MSELDIKQVVFRKGAAKRIPVSGTFELTSRCNLSCKMCYVHMDKDEQDKRGRELTTQEWIQLGREAVDAGMIYLLLTGGEPLLRPDFEEIYVALIQMGLMVTVNTNATLLTPQILACFQRYRPEKVNVTLYGFSDCTYGHLCGNSRGFDAAVRGVLALKAAGIRVNLNTTFTRYNIQDMDRIVDFAKENQIPIRMTSFIFPPVRNQHEPEDVNLTPAEMGRAAAYFDWITLEQDQRGKRGDLIRKYLEKGTAPPVDQKSRMSACMAGRGSFWVSWDGKMFPCGMLPDFEADVRNADFRSAWEKTCRNVWKMPLPTECQGCKYEKFCPACAAVSMSIHGKTDVLVEDICIRTDAYVKAFLEYCDENALQKQGSEKM